LGTEHRKADCDHHWQNTLIAAANTHEKPLALGVIIQRSSTAVAEFQLRLRR